MSSPGLLDINYFLTEVLNMTTHCKIQIPGKHELVNFTCRPRDSPSLRQQMLRQYHRIPKLLQQPGLNSLSVSKQLFLEFILHAVYSENEIHLDALLPDSLVCLVSDSKDDQEEFCSVD